MLLLLSNTVQNAIIGDDTSVTGGLVGATTLLAVNYIVVRFLFTHSKLDRLIEGQAVTLIEDGRLREDRLTKELVTRAELEPPPTSKALPRSATWIAPCWKPAA